MTTPPRSPPTHRPSSTSSPGARGASHPKASGCRHRPPPPHHHHTAAAGLPKPAESVAVRAALGAVPVANPSLFSPPATFPSRSVSSRSGRRRGSGRLARPTMRSCAGRAPSSGGATPCRSATAIATGPTPSTAGVALVAPALDGRRHLGPACRHRPAVLSALPGARRREDFLRHQSDVVQVRQVQHLQIRALQACGTPVRAVQPFEPPAFTTSVTTCRINRRSGHRASTSSSTSATTSC